MIHDPHAFVWTVASTSVAVWTCVCVCIVLVLLEELALKHFVEREDGW